MKRTIFCLLALCCVFSLFAQAKYDKIILLDGKEIQGIIVKNYEDKIEFSYPDEDMINVLSKEKIAKMVFRSGREEKVNLKTADEERYELLKNCKVLGNNDVLISDKSKINIIVELSESLVQRLEGEDIAAFKTAAAQQYIKGSEPRNKNSLARIGIIASSRFTLDPTARFKAVLHIMSADDDGEAYGYIEYFDLQSENPDKPIYSAYKNGDSESKSPKFPDRLLSGIKNCGSFHR